MKTIWRNQNHGSAQMIGTVVALLVAIAVGVLVWYKMNPLIAEQVYSGITNRSSASFNASMDAYTAINTSADTIWTLFPIVGIVIIAGIILVIVTNFGRGSST